MFLHTLVTFKIRALVQWNNDFEARYCGMLHKRL